MSTTMQSSGLLQVIRRRRAAFAWAGTLAVLAAVVAGALLATYRRVEETWLKTASTPAIVAAARTSPGDATLVYTAAERLWGQGKVAEALPLAQRAAALAPDRPAHHLLLGDLFATRQEPAAALREYRRAAALDPGLETANRAAGHLYVAAGMPDEAVAYFQRAWNPHHPDHVVRFGQIEAETELRRLPEAERMCREIVRFTPPFNVDGYRLLYRIKKAGGVPQEGEAALRAHIRRTGTPTLLPGAMYAELARMVLDQAPGTSRIREAERLAAQAVRQWQGGPEAYEVMGDVMARKGNHAGAVAMFRKALKVDPHDNRARGLMAISLRALGRPADLTPGQAARLAAYAPLPGPDAAAGVGPDRAGRLALAADLERRGDGAGAFRVCWPLIAGDPPAAEALAIANRALAPFATDSGGTGR